MSENDVTEIVLDEDDAAVIQRSLVSYKKKAGNVTDVEWLSNFLTEELPGEDPGKFASDAASMAETIVLVDNTRADLKESLTKGMSKQEWLQLELSEGVKGLNNAQTKTYFTFVDKAIKLANEEMRSTILRRDGEVNRNPHLDGLIAETEHANSFNLDAAIKGNTTVRAEALVPAPGQTYGKNSVDIVVKQNGKVIKRYQSKYGADSGRTQELFHKGNYRGQRKLIPEGQEVKTKHTHVIDHAGVRSQPLSKQSAKEKQQQAQDLGEIEEKTWDDFTLSQKTQGIASQAGKAGVYAAGASALFYVGEQLWKGEEIEGKELAKRVVKDGAKAGATVALSGAIKVIMEKRTKLPPGSPGPIVPSPSRWPIPVPDSAKNYAAVVIASTAVSSVSILARLGRDEITTSEAFDELTETSLSILGSIICAERGGRIAVKVIEKVLGASLGPVGIALTGFVGSTIGSMAGSVAGKYIAKGVSAVRKAAERAAEAVEGVVKSVVSTVKDNISTALVSFTALFN